MKKMLVVATAIVFAIQIVVISLTTLGLYVQNEMYRFYNDVGIAVALTFFCAYPIIIYFLVQRDQLISMNTVLKRAEKRAKKADIAKSAFIANMSHEIRTPLNGVMGMAELMVNSELNEKQKMFAEVIQNSSISLLMIVNDLLDFSKIESDQLMLDPAPFNLADVVEDTVQFFAPQFEQKSIELIVRISPDIPVQIVGDKVRLGQILINLLRNAIKFTEIGYVLVDVSGTFVDNGSKFELTISVEDTGIGISAENCNTIFEKFTQADTSATRLHSGAGLGLSISSSLVKLMNGRIGVDSKLGDGSTFWVDIKFPVHGDGVKKQMANFDIAGSKVLIVDDSSVNRSILVEQLTQWGIIVDEAANGLDAMTLLTCAKDAGKGYNLVLLDHQMPIMSGGDVAKEIRLDTHLADLPIIILSSVDEAGAEQSFEALNITSFLAKPVRSSQLHYQLSMALRGRKKVTDADYDSLFIDEFGNAGECLVENTANERIDVLVAEDNDVNQIVFTQILQATNWRFKIASDGAQAVEYYKLYRPKLILMDISMPIMNGHEACRAIRKMERENEYMVGAPIIAVTAHAVKGDRQKCLDAGMDDYITKPVSPEVLEKKIDLWMAEIVEREFSAEQDAMLLA